MFGGTLEFPVTPFRDLELSADEDGMTTVTLPTSWIRTISGFSGHCARQTLTEFAKAVDADHVALIHGPNDAQQSCEQYHEKKLDADVVTRASMGTPIPVYGATSEELTQVDLSHGAASSVTVRPESSVDTSHVTDALVGSEAEDTAPEPDSSGADGSTQESVEERIEQLEARIKELETELAAARHEGRWTQGELLELIREEVSETSTPVSDPEQPPEAIEVETLTRITGVGPQIIENLKADGYETFADVRTASVSELTAVDRVGEQLANKLVEHTRDKD